MFINTSNIMLPSLLHKSKGLNGGLNEEQIENTKKFITEWIKYEKQQKENTELQIPYKHLENAGNVNIGYVNKNEIFD